MSEQDPRVALDDQTIVRGDQFSWTVTITRSDGHGGTTPVDLTAYGTTWTGDLRGDPDYDTFVPWAIDASSAAAGVLVLSLSGATTAQLALDQYGFDLTVTGGVVSPQTPFRGTVYVVKDYTHA